MTQIRRLTIIALLLTSALAGSVRPLRAAEPVVPGDEASIATLLETIRANRRALIAASLNLSADEAAAFWPIYTRYQTELNAVGDRMAAIVEDYTAHFRDLSNDKALELMKGYLAAEAERLKIREAYLPEFSKVVPGRTVARFYQIENKMDAVIRYDLAKTIPVVDEQPAQ
jgi:hypothetical protein